MIRPADPEEAAVISRLLNTPIAIDDKKVPPLPVDEARGMTSDVLSQMVATADIDDYFIGCAGGTDADGLHYTTILGAINTALAFLLPGVMLKGDDARLVYYIDEDRFFSTLHGMKRGIGLVVNIKN